MKKLMTVILLVAATFAAKADRNEKLITIDQLPKKAQEFLQANFKDLQVAYVEKEVKPFGAEYEVYYTNRTKVEFRHDGEWKEIECKYNAVPASVVPKQIQEFIAKNNPQQSIKKIERNQYLWEVELHNDIEIKFDHKFALIGYDD